MPDILLLPAIADLFGVTVDELLRGERIREAPPREPTPTAEGTDSSDEAANDTAGGYAHETPVNEEENAAPPPRSTADPRALRRHDTRLGSAPSQPPPQALPVPLAVHPCPHRHRGMLGRDNLFRLLGGGHQLRIHLRSRPRRHPCRRAFAATPPKGKAVTHAQRKRTLPLNPYHSVKSSIYPTQNSIRSPRLPKPHPLSSIISR